MVDSYIHRFSNSQIEFFDFRFALDSLPLDRVTVFRAVSPLSKSSSLSFALFHAAGSPLIVKVSGSAVLRSSHSKTRSPERAALHREDLRVGAEIGGERHARGPGSCLKRGRGEQRDECGCAESAGHVADFRGRKRCWV